MPLNEFAYRKATKLAFVLFLMLALSPAALSTPYDDACKQGSALIEKRDYRGALEYLNKAIALEPKKARAYAEVSRVNGRLGQHKMVIDNCTTAIRLDPKCQLAYANRGNAYAQLKLFPQAIADCTKAISLDPKDLQSYSNRGSIYGELGQFDKSIADFNKAISIDPKDSISYINRGASYLNSGQYKKAIEDCDKGIAIKPNPVAYLIRSRAHEKLGEKDLAAKDAEMARKPFPH